MCLPSASSGGLSVEGLCASPAARSPSRGSLPFQSGFSNDNVRHPSTKCEHDLRGDKGKGGCGRRWGDEGWEGQMGRGNEGRRGRGRAERDGQGGGQRCEGRADQPWRTNVLSHGWDQRVSGSRDGGSGAHRIASLPYGLPRFWGNFI